MQDHPTTAIPDPAGLQLDDEHSWRHENLGRLLLIAFNLFEIRVLERIHAGGFADVRQVHFSVIRHVDFGGTRIVDLALRAGVTKAAMGQLVAACEQLGWVELRSDPTDGRAKIVRFSRSGLRLMKIARTALVESEREIAAMIGAKLFRELKRGLLVLRARSTGTLTPARRTPAARR